MADPTTYIVLRERVPEHGDWEYVVAVRANNPKAALHTLVPTLQPDDQSGTYVAIPLRSWKPVTVRAETVTTLKIEEAT